ncbi:hypothetical protein [Pseudoalteromonas sp. GB56]
MPINLDNYSIRIKMAVPLLAITLLLLIISLFSFKNANKLMGDLSQVSNSYVQSISKSINADRDLYQALTATQESDAA